MSEVDYIIEGDNQPAVELPNPPPTDVDRAVGKLIANEIEDGACLQIGIGGMPNAVCTQLLDSSARDLGIHTEMLTEGIIELYLAGRINGSRKTLNPGKIGFSFALGSKKLYDTINRNPDLECLAGGLYQLAAQDHAERSAWCRSTTPRRLICKARRLRSPTGIATSVAPAGNCSSCAAPMLRRVANRFICLSSTYDKRGERKSRIALNLTPGNIVTTPRSDVMYVVTEYGIVNLKGKSVAERATSLISIAHPDFREGLERQAHEHRLIPRGVSF